jgi:uncharacterized membrane protein
VKFGKRALVDGGNGQRSVLIVPPWAGINTIAVTTTCKKQTCAKSVLAIFVPET